MAITIEPVDPCDISVEDYLEHLDASVLVDDIEGLIETAPMLLGLSQRKGLAAGVLNAFLKHYLDKGSDAEVAHQSLFLGFRGNYAIRLNIWLPKPSARSPEEALLENRAQFYGVPHDHNFDFMSVGLHGCGYETRLYEYDRQDVDGLPGEHVEIAFREETTLPEGKLMLYRAFKDIHTQLPPKELSMSLNVLVDNHEYRIEPQFLFDVESSRILSHVHESRAHRMASIFDLAPALANEETVQLLHDISILAETPVLLRRAALNAINSLEHANVQVLAPNAGSETLQGSA